MALGPHVPAWRALRDALDALVKEAGALLAAVVDESDVLWCWSRVEDGHVLWKGSREATDRDVAELAGQFHVDVVAELSPPLHRGGAVDVSRWNRRGAPQWQAGRSFAGIYVLVLWFEQPRAVPAELAAALPKIEALTVALPPPDGPDATSGAAKMRA